MNLEKYDLQHLKSHSSKQIYFFQIVDHFSLHIWSVIIQQSIYHGELTHEIIPSKHCHGRLDRWISEEITQLSDCICQVQSHHFARACYISERMSAQKSGVCERCVVYVHIRHLGEIGRKVGDFVLTGVVGLDSSFRHLWLGLFLLLFFFSLSWYFLLAVHLRDHWTLFYYFFNISEPELFFSEVQIFHYKHSVLGKFIVL